jgi:hypothetical protein
MDNVQSSIRDIEKTQIKRHMGPYNMRNGSSPGKRTYAVVRGPHLERTPVRLPFRDFYIFNQPDKLGHINVETGSRCGKRSQGEP